MKPGWLAKDFFAQRLNGACPTIHVFKTLLLPVHAAKEESVLR
jgi:hypothetical protein